MRYLEFTNANKGKNHIIFIHGLGSSAERWLDLPEALSYYSDTIALDLIGFGKSEKPLDFGYAITDFVDIIKEFVLKKNLDDGKLILVGHSLGGYIACEFVITFPQLVEKLVLIDSSGMLKGPTPILEEYLDSALNPSTEKVIRVFKKMVVNPLLVIPGVAELFVKNLSSEAAKNSFKLTLTNSANTQISFEKLGKMNIPTLIIWGSEDKVIPLDYASIFHREICNSKLVIIEAGHAPFSEKPSVTFDIVKRFIVDEL